MKKLNILMLGSKLNVKGGMTTVVESFLQEDFDDINIKYIYTHEESNIIKQVFVFLWAILKINYALLFKNISIIHVHFSERGSFLRKNIVTYLGKLYGKSIIIHMHGAEFKEFFESSSYKDKIIKFLLRADKVIVLGNSWDSYVKSLNNKINTVIMRNSVECVKETVEFKDKNVNILFLAVITERKGILDLVRAANIIKKDSDLEEYNINFIIAGSGKEENKVQELVSSLGLSDLFIFEGWVGKEKKIELLKKSQLFILPSYNEGLPLSILEAMSYGLPIITTNVGSIEDAVINGFNGIIIEPGKVEDIAKAIKDIIINKKRWKLFSKNSKALINNHYNKDKYFNKIRDLYKEIG